MSYSVTLIPGDTTGPVVADCTKRVISAVGVEVDWNEYSIDDGQISDELLASLNETGVGLMGFHHHARKNSNLPPVVQLRKALSIFANIRPVRSMEGLPSPHNDIDLVVIRETTEDIYAHLEHESIPGVFESLKVTTHAACERIARYAFEYARKHGRKKVTIVHKANIMKKSDGMFLRVAQKVAEEFPDIQAEDVIVDALCMRLVLHPSRFDILVAGNLYGDIVSDLTAGLVGEGSHPPSINVGQKVTIFASPHGDLDTEGQPGRGNPISLLNPATSMLRHLGEQAAADRIWAAIEQVTASGLAPHSAGGSTDCCDFVDAVCAKL